MITVNMIKNKPIHFMGLSRSDLDDYTPLSIFVDYAREYRKAHKRPLWMDKTFSEAVVVMVYEGWILASMGLESDAFAWDAFVRQWHYRYRYAQAVMGALMVESDESV